MYEHCTLSPAADIVLCCVSTAQYCRTRHGRCSIGQGVAGRTEPKQSRSHPTLWSWPIDIQTLNLFFNDISSGTKNISNIRYELHRQTEAREPGREGGRKGMRKEARDGEGWVGGTGKGGWEGGRKGEREGGREGPEPAEGRDGPRKDGRRVGWREGCLEGRNGWGLEGGREVREGRGQRPRDDETESG